MTRVIIGAFDYLRKALTRARSPSQIPLPFRAVLGRSNISGIHPEILLVHGIVVINNNYNYAMDKQYFRMNSENIASPEHYPSYVLYWGQIMQYYYSKTTSRKQLFN